MFSTRARCEVRVQHTRLSIIKCAGKVRLAYGYTTKIDFGITPDSSGWNVDECGCPAAVIGQPQSLKR